VKPFATLTKATPCWTLQRHGQLAEARSCFESLARGANALDTAEAFWGLGDFQAANDAFRAAHTLSPNDPYVKARWGRLFLDRYNPDEATRLFDEALKIDEQHVPALVGMAIAASQGFNPIAYELLDKAIKADPKHVEAHEVLATVKLEDSDELGAKEAAEKALQLDPKSGDAMALLATIDLLRDQTTPWLDRMLAANPHHGRGFRLAAHLHVINRRYEEAITLYRRAIEADPSLDQARSELGINLMRLGREEEAREQLEAAYENGYRNAGTVNSLRLMDSYKNFETFRTPRYILRLHKKEAALLRPYFEAQLTQALDTFERKYGVKVGVPVQLEVYPDHEDFAVRTLGMPGLGALGVTFGSIVAMDSPSGRDPGSFHWASTLWHELSHVFTLTATKHRIPRWFTEGIAVHEETATHADWGDRLDPRMAAAVRDGKLLPIEKLDRGFTRPQTPSQVIISYFQGGRVCDFIVERWGWEKILAMLQDFSKSTPTATVIEKQLGLKTEQFDAEFWKWLDGKIGGQVKAFEDWRKRLRTVSEALKAKDFDKAIQEGEAIRDQFPEYVEAGSVYELLADAHEARNNIAAARKHLEQYARIGGRNPKTLLRLARLQEKEGDRAATLATLDKLNWIDLREEEAHKLMGETALALNQPQTAVREFRAASYINRTDPAARLFDLARAYRAAGQVQEAKDALFEALEAAPNFKPAQKLLLELESGS
jgi:tetratricopeptide (TPR) repeat protein